MCMFMLESHLPIEGIAFLAWEMNALTYSFSMLFFKLQIELSCRVDVGEIDGQYGVSWLVRWKGVLTM